MLHLQHKGISIVEESRREHTCIVQGDSRQPFGDVGTEGHT